MFSNMKAYDAAKRIVSANIAFLCIIKQFLHITRQILRLHNNKWIINKHYHPNEEIFLAKKINSDTYPDKPSVCLYLQRYTLKKYGSNFSNN